MISWIAQELFLEDDNSNKVVLDFCDRKLMTKRCDYVLCSFHGTARKKVNSLTNHQFITLIFFCVIASVFYSSTWRVSIVYSALGL